MSYHPALKQRNILLFLLLTMANNAWFIMGNWIFFWLRYMTYGQLGWIDAICFAFGMVMEVPTGAISDLVGKKKTLALAQFFSALGFLLMGTAGDKYQILIGFLITQTGWAFYSGAAEALAYDSLKETNHEEHFDRVISTSNMLSIIFTVLCTLAGIWLYQWNFRAPHLALVLTYGFGFILALCLKEPKVDSDHFSFKNYFSQLSEGTKQLMQPNLKKFLPMIFVLLGVYYMFSYGFIKPATSEYFHFYATEQGFIFAVLNIVSAVLIHFVPVLRKKLSDGQGLIVLTTLLGSGFLLAGMLEGWIAGLTVITMIVCAGSLASPWVSVVVNREIPSRYRATTLSTVSMFTKIPYILAAVVAGQLIQDGFMAQFNLFVGVVTLLAVTVGFLLLKRNSSVTE